MNVKTTAKSWTKKAFLGSPVLRIVRRFTSPRAVILGYHSVQDRPELFASFLGSGLTHPTCIFQRQMELLARKYTPVNIEAITLFLREGARLPRNAVAVTFDDGYRDNYEIVGPILQRLGIPATFYLTAGWIGTNEIPWFCRLRHAFGTTSRTEWNDPMRAQLWNLSDPENRKAALSAAFDLAAAMDHDTCQAAVHAIEQQLAVVPLAFDGPLMMTWENAKELYKAGHVIGSHTMSHPNVAHLRGEGAMRWELIESKRQIEEKLQASVAHFCYPHPGLKTQWSAKTTEIVQQAGYRTAGTTKGGPVYGKTNPFALNRLIAPLGEDNFLWALETGFLGHAA